MTWATSPCFVTRKFSLVKQVVLLTLFTFGKTSNVLISNQSYIYSSSFMKDFKTKIKRRLQSSKENIQHFRTWNSSILCLFVSHFLPSLIRMPVNNQIIIKHCFVLGDCKSEVAREKESQVAIRKKITEESKTTGINTSLKNNNVTENVFLMTVHMPWFLRR